MTATIRRVRADEWRALRDLRLSALAGAPHMFGTTLASARQRSEVEWQDAARRGEGTDAWVTFVAEDAGALVGMATGIKEADLFELIQMWVEPRARRKGLGIALGEAVLGWARDRGASFVRLAVNESDAAAPALYRTLGFVDTGRREPDLFEGRDGLAMVMERRISPSRRVR